MSTNQKLLAAVDNLITKHGATNPELLKELLKLRTEIQVTATLDKAKLAGVALRITTWVKFIYDMMDDGP